MDAQRMDRFRQSLEERRESVVEWLRLAPPEERARVTNGVLSNGVDPNLTVVQELDRALERVGDGTFGRCDLCENDDVEEERLLLDFTTRVCLAHFSQAQLDALERDLELAAQVQLQLFPKWVPALNGVQLASNATAGRIVSGDYFDFFRFRNDDQGAIIADVMGAGLPAGILMSSLQASLRLVGPDYDDPDGLARRLNELFRYNLKLIRFISMVLVAFDPERRQFRYTNAGHNPPLLYRPIDGTYSWLKPTGPAIGLLPEPPFHTGTVDTKPGDVLVLYTDGLVEARFAGESPFGEERLLSYVAEHSDESADDVARGLWTAVRRHSGGGMTDDMAVIVARFV
ncbi:MAG TPA: PP2C family protein-serine/threonine phosphatase [Rhodothermales bacterium]